MYRSSFRGIATALVVACSPLAFATVAHAAVHRPAAVAAFAQNKLDAWCLQGDSAGVDCSFSNRSQCEASAAGGLGECVPMIPGMRERD